MPRTTELLSGTTASSRGGDLIDDVLADLRVSGTILLNEAYAPPWGIAVPDEARLRELLGIGADTRVLPFHLVLRHHFVFASAGKPDVVVAEDEVALCAGGAHTLSRGTTSQPVPFEAILASRGPPSAALDDPVATRLVCGVFMVRAASLNPMLAALPGVLKVSTQRLGTPGALPQVAAALIVEATAGRNGFTVSRLLEVFCAEIIRAHQADAGNAEPGWFRGMDDARIGQALRHIHADPVRAWSVEALAASAALSPSRFAARFREFTGQSVMGYVARWRMNLACRMLRDTDLPVAELAERVGYGSLPAFSRAFKTHVGVAPIQWRRTSAAARPG